MIYDRCWGLALLVVVFIPLTMFFSSCKDDLAAVPGKVTISGIVTDFATGIPISGVSVRGQLSSSTPQTSITDNQGNYSFVFDVDSTASVSIFTSKAGYRDTTLVARVSSGVPFPLNIVLTPKSTVGVGPGSGIAQTIAFLGADPQEISVYGVGGQETSILGFEVRDSLGFPIDATKAVTLRFSVGGGLDGGEYISPPTLVTNAQGRAYTTFNSGIRSGVVQIVASTTVGSRTITSSPVRVIIHAGFPHQTHFSIGAERLNFPALGIVGRTNKIGVLVGDKYSNPVVPNTAVYFKSGAGVIQASAFTDQSGLGTVTLFSGNPQPTTGYHYVTARTIGEGGVTVQDSILLLWSGVTRITPITPDTFTIGNGGFRNFSFSVFDQNGNPIAAGSSISVKAIVSPPPDPNAPVNQVQLAFGNEGTIVLGDELFPGPGRTDFTFRVSDGTISIDTPTVVTVSVSVTSSTNGDASRSISGIVR